MAVRIRLTRVGATKRPAYRVVAIDKRRSRDGRALEILGYYDPLTEPATVHLETDRIQAWIGNGALPSDTVAKLMRQAEKAAEEPPTEKPKRATRSTKPKPSAKAKAKAKAAAEADATPAPESKGVADSDAAPEAEAAHEADAIAEPDTAPEAEATPEAEAEAATTDDPDKADA
ncbi:MAG: 30S ribosomal protein S16 [Candidatus Limnocylindria bacterium]